MNIDAPELVPYLIYRIENGQMQCALWKVAGGWQALALFQSADHAEVYRQATGLADSWRGFSPTRDDLLTILKHCHESGITMAVLNPDQQQAARVFDLHAILQQATAPDAGRD